MNWAHVMLKHRVFFTGIVFLGLLLSGCNRTPAPAGGELSFQDQIDQARQETDVELRAKALIRIGLQQGKSHDAAGAESTLALAWKDCDVIADPAARANAFALMAEAEAALDERSAARRASDSALASAGDVEPLDGRAAALARAAQAQFVANDAEAAKATLQSAEELAGKVEALEDRTAALCAIARAYHKMEKPGERDRVLDAALTLAKSIDDSRKRSLALARIAVKQSELDEQAASKTFDLAVESAGKVESPYTRVYALCDVAERYSEAGFHAKAHETLDLAERAAEDIAERDTQTQALQKIRAMTDRLPNGG